MSKEDSQKQIPQINQIPSQSETQTEQNIQVQPIETKQEEYGETPYRWYVMISYFLLTFANGLQWVTFSACADNFSSAYNMPSWKVNMFSLMYMIIYPFVCIPEGWLVDSYSTRLGLIISAACTLSGAAMKLLVNKSMACAFIGQFLAGLFQPAILNSPGKIAANWFREDIRTLICTICCLSDTIGIFVGFLFHVPIIDDDAEGQEFKDDFFKYVFWEFILNAVFCIPTFFIFKNKPDIPPSPSQKVENTPQTPGLVDSLKLLFTNKRFIYLLISTLFIVGYYDVYGTIINSYFAIYNITDSQCSYIYAVSSVIGMISSLVMSWLLDKYKKFKLFMIGMAIVGSVFQALLTLLLELSVNHKSVNAYAVGMVMYSLVNAIVIPFYTIGMNYACEITYPVGESINGGIMMSMSQISGIAGTFLCDHLINHQEKKKYLSNIVLLGFFVIACIFVFLFDEKLDRHEVDAQGRNKIDDGKKDNNDKDDSDEKKNIDENLDNPDKIEVKNNNNNEENDENNGVKTAKELLKA